jgi:hypothetical protein
MAMVRKKDFWESGTRRVVYLNTSNAGSIHLYPSFGKYSLLLKKAERKQGAI